MRYLCATKSGGGVDGDDEAPPCNFETDKLQETGVIKNYPRTNHLRTLDVS